MKKTYLLILGLGLTSISFAQKKIVDKMPETDGLTIDEGSHKGNKTQNLVSKAGGQVLYNETFNGSISNWTTSGADGSIWQFDLNGPDGTYSATDNSDIIESSTAANGFMIFDADLSNPNQPYANRIGSLVSPVIDLTGITSVNIKFQHEYRTCCSGAFIPQVEVSTDGFTTFTSFNVTAPGIGVNNLSGTVVKELNINSYLAAASNLQNFQFRFNFDGIAGASSHYFWQVDDIQLIVPNDYSLVAQLDYWGTLGFWGARLPYSQIPSSQVQPIDFSAIVENTGAVNQGDVVLNTSIPEGAFTNTGALTTLIASQVDTVSASASFTPSNALNVYNPSYSITSSQTDIDPIDNLLVGVPIEVTNSVYSRDMITLDGGTYNQGEAYEVGNIFDIFTDAQTEQGSVWVRSTSNAGAQIYLRLYSIDGATGDFIFMEESAPYIVTATDLGTLVTLNLQTTQDLIADQSYLLVVGTLGDGGASNDLYTGTSGTSEAQTSFFLDETGTWFYTTKTPIVRMNLFTPVTISSSNPSYTFCSGGSMTLTSSSATGNQWKLNGTDIVGETNTTLVVTAPGVYSVTAAGITSPAVNASIQIINNGINVFATNLVSSETNADATYQWIDCSNSSNINGATSNIFAPLVSGDYQVQISLNGCVSTTSCATFSVILAATSSDLDLVLCPGGSLTLSSNIAGGNTWSTGETTDVITVTTSGTYTVSNGTQTTEDIIVTVLSIDAAVTGTTTLTATQGGNATFQWMSNCNTSAVDIAGQTAQSFTPISDGNYSVEITLGGCVVSSACTPVDLPLSISAGGSTILCPNGNVVLTSSETSGNVWSTGATTQSITVTAAGTYTCVVAGTSSNAITVTMTSIDNTVAQSTNTVDLSSNQGGATYMWVNCSADTVSLGTNQTFSAATNGLYKVYVTVNGCTSSSTCLTVQGVGIVENDAFSSFSVYPNPAAENVAIDYALKNESKVNVSILDLSGKVVYTSNLGSKTAGSHNLSVNTTSFANGIYVVNFATENGIVTEKLVIRK